jgi:hypothetical protein
MTGKEKRAPVIARNEAPKGQVTKQSAKEELPKESLGVRIAPQSGMQKTHFSR